MKRLSILLVAGILLFVPALAFSANGDTLNIGGQVPLTLSLTVNPTTGHDNLDLHSADVGVNIEIAQISVSTNNTEGWELLVYAANADAGTSYLRNADGNEFTYTLTFDATVNQPITTTGLTLKDDPTNGTEANTPLVINYTQDSVAPAGYYSDQLSIVLRAK